MASVDITSVIIQAKSDGIDQATKSLNSLADASDRAESATSNLGTTAKKTSSAYADGVIAADKLLATYQKQVDLLGANISQQMAYNVAMKGGNESQVQAALALGAQQDAYKRLASDQAEAIRMNKAFDRSLQDVGSSAGHAASGTSGITRELLVLGHEMSQGQFSRFGGSMMVLAERVDISAGAAEGLKKVLSGLMPIVSALINPITLTAAALIAVGVAAFKGASEQKAFNNALILTGNYAGATSSSLDRMAHSAVDAGGSIGAAKKTVLELAESGKFTANQINFITDAIVSFEHATGKSGESVVKEFERIAEMAVTSTSRSTDTISKHVLTLNDKYHFLSAAQFAQISLLEKEGEKQEAINMAEEKYAEALKTRSEEIVKNLGTIQRAWHSIIDAAGKAWDAMLGIGKKSTAADEVERLKKILTTMDARPGWMSGKDQGGSFQKSFEESRLRIAEELTTAVIKLNAEDAKALQIGKDQQTQSAAAHAVARTMAIEQQVSKESKVARMLKESAENDEIAKKAIALDLASGDAAKIAAAEKIQGLYTEQAILKRNAEITAQFGEKQKKIKAEGFADINLEISAIKSMMQAQLDSADSQIKSIKNLSDEKKINVFEEQKETKAALEMKLQAIKTGETAELTAIAQDINRKGRSATEVKELQNRYVQAYTASEKAINGVNEALNKNDKLVSTLAGKAADAQATANAKVIDSLKASTEAIQAKIDAYNRLPEAVRNAGVTDKQIQDEITQSYINNRKDELAQTIENNNVEEPIAKARIDFLKLEIMLLEQRKSAQKVGESQQAVNKFNLGFAARSKEEAAMAVQAFNDAGKEISTNLQTMFGDAAKPMEGFFTAFTNGLAKQTAAQEKLNKVKEAYKDAPEAIKNQKIQEATINLTKENAQIAIQSFGDIAGAAQGFFDKQSKGYALMGGISKAFHAAEIALQTASIARKLAAGAATMFGQGGFAGFAGVAAMVAVMAGLGFASSGVSSAPPTSAQRQSQNGTGSVLGDSNAKSDSIQKSLDIIAKDSGLGLVHFNSMDNSLKQLVSGITGLSNLLVSGTKLTAAIPANSYNTGVAGTVVKSVMMAFGDVLGASGFIDKITGGLNTKITSAIFGGKTSVEDVGLNVGKSSLGSILQNGANVNQYTDVKKTGGWFSSDKYSTQTQSLGAEVNNQFSMVIQSLADTISASAKVLGMSGDSFNEHLKSFVIDIGNISTKGLTGTQIQEALQTAFSKLGDDMAKFAIQGLDKFQKVGEGYLETVARIANDLIQVQDVFAVLGKTLNLTGMDAVNASENLVKLFGGVDKLASATKGFIDDFLTDAEKLAPVQASLNKELERLHLSTTMSADDYKKLVMSQDLTTTSGQELYAALLNLEPAFKQVTDAADAATKAAQAKADSDMKAAVDAAKNLAQNDFNVLSKAITQAKNDAQAAYNAQVAILNAQVSSLTTVKQNIDSLGAALDSALHSMTDNTVYAMSRVQAQAALDQLLNDARTTGKLPTAESMKDILSTLGKDPAAQYSNYADYIKDVGITAGKISNLSDITKGQKTVVERQLEVAKDQLSVAKNTLDRATSGFDMLQNIAQEQLDAMNGTTVLIKDLTTAMQAFAKSVTSGTQIQAGATGSNGLPINTATTPAAMTTGVITSIYEHLLNRAPDAQGLANATDWMNHGGTALDLANNIMQSQEYKSINGSHANGLDNVPFDGYTAKLHKGEMVLPAKQAKGVVQGEDLKALIQAVQQSGTETASTQSMMQSDIRWLKKLFQQMAPSGDRLQMHDVGAA